MGKGIEGVGQKLKDTFTTLFKGGKVVADWVGGGIKAFINNVLKENPVDVKEGKPLGIREGLTKGLKFFKLYGLFDSLGFTGGKKGQVDKFPNLLNIINPLKFYPLLFKSFFGKRDETETITGGSSTAVVSDEQDNKNSANAEAVAAETTYESGEGNEVIVPVPVVQVKEVRTNKRGSGVRGRKKDSVDQSALSMYAGK